MWFEKCLDALPAVKGLKGRPRRRPAKLHADKGYDYKRYNLRFNVDYQATDWLTIKPKVWATRSDVMDQQQVFCLQ